MKLVVNLEQCKNLAQLEAVWNAIREAEVWESLSKEEKALLEAGYECKKEELEEDYDDTYPEYDFSKFKVATKSWQEINPKGLTYWNWLHQEAIPKFWVQPQLELQGRLLAICCAINSAAIPAWNHSARKEAQLPILYFYGESGSGKTEGNKLIAQSHNFRHYALYKADSSGASLRNTLHSLCFKSEIASNPNDANLYPAFILLDNYEPKFMEKWSEYKVMILSVIRSQSKCQIATKDGENIVYWGHILKSFTSVVHPKAMNRAGSEFYRRFVFFYTAKSAVQSMSNYDFSDIPQIYKDLWNPSDVVNKFFPILQQLLIKDDDSTTIPFHRWQQTLVLLATGVYAGIFGSIQEGIDFFTDYWQWIELKEEATSSSTEIVFNKIIDEALDFHHKAKQKGNTADLYPIISLNNELPRIKKMLPEQSYVEKQFVDYLTLQGWCYKLLAGNPYYELRMD